MSVTTPKYANFRQLCAVFARYLVAGGLGFVLDYATLALCYEILGLHYLVAAALGFLAGLIFVYISSNKLVFSQRRMEARAWLEFLIFALIGIIGLGLTLLFMWIFVDVCHIYPLISKLITTALVLLWNFFARKIILYS